MNSSLSGNSGMLNQSLKEDWMVLGGVKTQWVWPEREHELKISYANPWKKILNFLTGESTESSESLGLVRNLICCKRRNLQKAVWPPSLFKVSVHQKCHRELLMLQQTAVTKTGLRHLRPGCKNCSAVLSLQRQSQYSNEDALIITKTGHFFGAVLENSFAIADAASSC